MLTQITTTLQPKPFDGRCPYKGLDVFEEEDAEFFFGRERLVEELLSRVKQSRTVFITGPSGSGKSSLVRAGLIHALKQGAIKESERWLYETMKPGREPLKDLALAFSRLKSPELANYFQAHAHETGVLHECAESVLSGRADQRLVLFVDQFEEVFTQVGSEEERLAFLEMLAHAGTAKNGRVIVLFAMRSDFVSNCATYPSLNELLSQQFRQIGAMQPEELVSAIALPAKHVGLPVEAELISRIINDMKGEPGALPLMQFALRDLFDAQEQGGVIALTLEDYLRHGGIHKSLERHADKSFAQLSENEQNLARSIFSGLIEIGRGTSDTRRTALFEELIPAGAKAQDVLTIVQKLADARLIITDEQAGKDTVTISHEKLIDAWPWLKKLINENRDAISLQNQVAEDAVEWDEHRRDLSYLYTGARLANAREQLVDRKIVLNGLAQEFLRTSTEADEADDQRAEARRHKELDDARRYAEAAEARLRAERRARRGLQVLTAVLSILMLGAIIILARPYVLRGMGQGEMASIPAGPVVIGADDPEASEEEMPQWTTRLEAFQIDRYEVTNHQYGLCVSVGRCDQPHDPSDFNNPAYADLPVAAVTAYQADTYCRWLGKRLPTELEWERAARGPDGRDWPWGKTPPSPEVANLAFDDALDGGLLPVTSLSAGATPEPEYIFHLIGNVWEWTSSYLQGYEQYDETLYWDSRLGAPAFALVQRGGSWDDISLIRVTRRDSELASNDEQSAGIRCAKSQ